MRERDPAQPSLGANPFSGEAPTQANLREFRRKHCAQCGRPFGLTRRRRAGKQFCSAQCVREYDAQSEARAHWYDFLPQWR
jgi:hypothetical protein